MIVLNALAVRSGGAAVRVCEVARRAPGLWQTDVMLLRNEGAGIDVDPEPNRIIRGWPQPLVHAPAVPRRVLEAATVRWHCRDRPVGALLHCGNYVPMRTRAGVMNVLCFNSLAPWDPGPSASSARNRMLRRLFERTHARADMIIVQSHATREILADRYPGTADRLTVLVNGLAVPSLVRSAQPRGFLLVGHLHGYRRIEAVVRAYAALAADVQARHPLILAGHLGRDTLAAQQLNRALADTGLTTQVQRLGSVTRPRALELMSGAAAFISYATVENGPNALGEARAAGAPLILSDLPVHREFGGSDATYVDSFDGLVGAMRAAAVAAEACSNAEQRPAVDTWGDHVIRLGAELAARGALIAPIPSCKAGT